MFHGLCHLIDEQGNAKNKICPECDTPFKVEQTLFLTYNFFSINRKKKRAAAENI